MVISAAETPFAPACALDAYFLCPTSPVAIGRDPLRAPRTRPRERQIEDRDRLSRAAAPADGDDLIVGGHVDPLNSRCTAQDLHLERRGQMFFEHRAEAAAHLRFVIGVDDRFSDQRLEPGFAWRPAAGFWSCFLLRGAYLGIGDPRPNVPGARPESRAAVFFQRGPERDGRDQ